MAGHVPRFSSPDDGGFTETFAIARSGGRSGSGGERQRGSKVDDTAATTNNPPPARRQPHRNRSAATPTPAPAPAPARRSTRTKPAPASDGDSHIPSFGTWDVDADQNYTGIFQAASKARKGEAGGGPAPQPASSGRKGDGDLYKAHSKKRSSSWCCFGA